MTEKDYQVLKEQIIQIQRTGLTNMFDVNMVQRLAFDRGLFLLVTFLSEGINRKAYANFILRGAFE